MWYHRVMLIRECAFESLVKGLPCAEICELCVWWQSYDIMCVCPSAVVAGVSVSRGMRCESPLGAHWRGMSLRRCETCWECLLRNPETKPGTYLLSVLDAYIGQGSSFLSM